VGGSWGDNEVFTRSSKGSNHSSCSTNKPSYWMMCRFYTNILSVKCLVLTFQLDMVLVGFLGISCRIPSMTFTVVNWTKVSFYLRSYYTNSIIYQRKAWCVWLWFLFLSRVSWNQRHSEPPQCITNQLNIRGLHSAEGHWIPWIFSTILCFIRNHQLNWKFHYH